MKRILVLGLCALLLCGCGKAAPAPERTPAAESVHTAEPTVDPSAEPTPVPTQTPIPTTYVEEGMVTVIDLDGDKEKEQIEIEVVQVSEYMAYRTVRVTDGNVSQSAGETIIESRARITLCDLDGDRVPEILFSGDVASDDFITYACRWTASGLQPILFTTDERDNANSSLQHVDGGVEVAENGVVTLSSHLFMLGTYAGFRPYELKDSGSIGPVEGSVWELCRNDFWLETAMDLNEELPAGTKLRLTAADGVGEVWYVTEDGRTGSLNLTKSEDKWGWCINGVHELDCFVMLPYAG